MAERRLSSKPASATSARRIREILRGSWGLTTTRAPRPPNRENFLFSRLNDLVHPLPGLGDHLLDLFFGALDLVLPGGLLLLVEQVHGLMPRLADRDLALRAVLLGDFAEVAAALLRG